jgi:hypothetical protein
MDRQENRVSEKQVTKKVSLAKSIFKWLFVTLFAVLLIAAVVFQAPWKVITLLVIFLLACTVLPRPARKWFWLSVGVVVIGLVIWVFLPDRNGGWRLYTFDEELTALEAKYAIPDSENAAMIYNQLLEEYASTSFEPNFADCNLEYLIRHEPWSSKDYPEVAQWLQQHNNTVAKLLEASKIEKCHFSINATPYKTIERSPMMRYWAYLLIRAANNDLGEGRIDQALEKYVAVLRMAEHLYQQPAMIDVLVGMAVEALAIRQFKRFIVTENPTEEHLSVVETVLAEIKHDWCVDLPGFLEYEKLLYKNILAVFYETNTKGQIRLSRNPIARMQAQFPEMAPRQTYWWRKFIKANTILGWFLMPSMPSSLQKVAKNIDASYERLYAMADPDFDWRKEPETISITSLFSFPGINYRRMIKLENRMMENQLHSIHDIYVRGTAVQRGCQIMIVLRRHKNKSGYWPESLDDIKSLSPAEIFVDPINGGPFVYKLTEENFTLYSKGKNNIDEGGEYNSHLDPNTFEKTIEEDDWLIWPPESRCESENINSE